MGVCPVSSCRGLLILGPMRALVSLSYSILLLILLCFKLKHFIVLYGNALVLTPRIDPG
jgi:hypothetical protein